MIALVEVRFSTGLDQRARQGGPFCYAPIQLVVAECGDGLPRRQPDRGRPLRHVARRPDANRQGTRDLAVAAAVVPLESQDLSGVPHGQSLRWHSTARVAFRVVKWLRKRGYATDDCDYASNDTPKRSFADLLAQVATQRGTVENIKDDAAENRNPAESAAPLLDEAITRHGFNLHAGITPF